MKIKRILSLLVALTLVCSFMTMTNVQAAEDEFAILSSLGIMTDFSDDTTPITRYQLAEIAVQLTGITPDGNGDPVYPDIPAKHKYFPVVNAVTNEGLMGGLADGSFSPDAKASAMDGGRMLLAELGYTAFAAQAGWTDAQYNSKVQSLGLMNGVDASEGLTYSGIGKMMINMLTKKVMEIVSINSEGIEFKESNLTYIESKYGYKIRTGILQAAGSSSISTAIPVTDKQVVIDGVLYKTEGQDLSRYVGYNVKFIVTSEFEDGKVIHVEKYKGSEELVLDADDIISYSNYTYTYKDEKGSTEVVSFPSTSRFIVNGRNMASYDARYFTPDLGSVTLIDTNADSVYDIVNITSKVYVKIGGSTATAISNGWTSEAYDTRNKTTYITNEGKSAEITSLEVGSYAELLMDRIIFSTVEGNEIVKPDEANAEILKMDVLGDTTKVTGTINTRRTDAVGIDGKIYKFSKYYHDLVKSDYVDQVALGSTATIVLNNKEQIIDIIDVVSSYSDESIIKTYGYMTKLNPARGEDGQAIVRIVDFTTLEEIPYETAKECKVNGVEFNYGNAATFGAGTNTSFYLPDGNFKHQPVRFVLDEEGRITDLYLAVDRSRQYVTNHILPLTKADYTPTTTIDYYATSGANKVLNPDYDPKYAGYDDNNFTLDKDGYIGVYDKSFDGLYTVKDDTIKVSIPVDMAIDGSGATLGETDTEHYNAFANVQDPQYWTISYSGNPERSAMASNDFMTNNADYKGSYMAVYDADENYVPGIAIKYIKSAPKGDGTAVLSGVQMGDARYENSYRYWYITNVESVFDEKTSEEKLEVTAKAATRDGVETSKFTVVNNILETGQQNKRKVAGYTFKNDMDNPGDYMIASTAYAIDWNSLKKGDIIEVRRDAAGYVSGFRHAVDGDIIKDYDSLQCGNIYRSSWGSEVAAITVNLAYCIKAGGEENGLIVDLGGPNAELSSLKKIDTLDYKVGGYLSIQGAGMIINLSSGQCTKATLDDVKVGDYVLYRKNYGTAVEVFILRP